MIPTAQEAFDAIADQAAKLAAENSKPFTPMMPTAQEALEAIAAAERMLEPDPPESVLEPASVQQQTAMHVGSTHESTEVQKQIDTCLESRIDVPLDAIDALAAQLRQKLMEQPIKPLDQYNLTQEPQTRRCCLIADRSLPQENNAPPYHSSGWPSASSVSGAAATSSTPQHPQQDVYAIALPWNQPQQPEAFASQLLKQISASVISSLHQTRATAEDAPDISQQPPWKKKRQQEFSASHSPDPAPSQEVTIDEELRHIINGRMQI